MERLSVTFNLDAFRIVGILILSCAWIQNAAAQDPNPGKQSVVSTNQTAYRLKTLGGKQFWTDNYHCGGWRIQNNAVSNHYRLIDPDNRRHASGTRDECLSKLEELKSEGVIKPTTGRIVIVLHGLIRTTDSMRRLGRYLQDTGDFTAVDFEYASTRKPVAFHAAALSGVIDSLGSDVTEINFVAHSMGNIVVRHYLADLKRAGKTEKRFGRMVMIGPPNQGSKMARIMRWTMVFNVLAGTAGYELGYGWEKLESNLATPEFEFGIIAGGQRPNQKLSNLFLNGRDDFTVSVEETKLPGAADFLIKPLFHGTMMRQQLTLEAAHTFLNYGYFTTAEQRNPIKMQINDSIETESP